MSSPFYRPILGNFVIIGKQPDGDSIRFVADNPNLYQYLHRAYRIKPSRVDGSVQLRLEGIDAPETHYGKAAQPLGKEARDRFLDWIGFKNIEYKKNEVLNSEPNTVPGAILTKAADANGRPISYVILQTDGLEDQKWVMVDDELLEKTANYHMISTGYAYYTVYTSTPFTHRQLLRRVAETAREKKLGIWKKDTTSEFILDDAEDIGPKGQLILPKLFRRCTDYLKAVEDGFRGNLEDWLIDTSKMLSRNENDRLVLKDSTEVRLSEILEQRNSKIVFQADLLDITFVEK
ncbi:thermonuclease family protein [Planktothrix sp. FACHB-1355]|uniref:Thermonuclease family protein n=1 Tax=Aerosakkonema funiforme FACHB-1375 TaxID=2949571 RepID=A0A926ZFC4_9CYAN|nr:MULTISPECIES: thermonuclease family protein [Oscillatoriales]MBD2180695.1 thermonuclease family protein [Aerosakkonema funiforme FACHB-1375]MBD3559531.1 thermonuclease family protein [Planktothrix sp. FACHB-1355]